MTLVKTLLPATIILFSQLAQADCPGGTMSTGWCWPTPIGEWTTNYLGWHGSNEGFSGTHLAKDIDATENDPVYAVSYGVVLIARTDVNNYGGATNCRTVNGKLVAESITGAGTVIRHYTSFGKPVDVLYAHLKELQVKRGDVIVPGAIVGKIRNYTWCGKRMDHLHLGAVDPARDMAAYDRNGTSDVWAGYGATDRASLTRSSSLLTIRLVARSTPVILPKSAAPSVPMARSAGTLPSTTVSKPRSGTTLRP